jgi:hypothetical protein
MIAEKAFTTCVDFKMLVKVGFLSEGKLATLVMADVWSFFCMNSKVVVEVMPFSKNFLAVFVGAAK